MVVDSVGCQLTGLWDTRIHPHECGFKYACANSDLCLEANTKRIHKALFRIISKHIIQMVARKKESDCSNENLGGHTLSLQCTQQFIDERRGILNTPQLEGRELKAV